MQEIGGNPPSEILELRIIASEAEFHVTLSLAAHNHLIDTQPLPVKARGTQQDQLSKNTNYSKYKFNFCIMYSNKRQYRFKLKKIENQENMKRYQAHLAVHWSYITYQGIKRNARLSRQ